MDKGPPTFVCCPTCQKEAQRELTVPSVIYAEGFSKDYWSKNPGRGQPWDKKEWLNKNWSKHYGEAPPKEDSKGSYE